MEYSHFFLLLILFRFRFVAIRHTHTRSLVLKAFNQLLFFGKSFTQDALPVASKPQAQRTTTGETAGMVGCNRFGRIRQQWCPCDRLRCVRAEPRPFFFFFFNLVRFSLWLSFYVCDELFVLHTNILCIYFIFGCLRWLVLHSRIFRFGRAHSRVHKKKKKKKKRLI